MPKQLLLYELKGKHYLYDAENHAFLPLDYPGVIIPFSEFQKGADPGEAVSCFHLVQEMKLKTGTLIIQSHAVYGIKPSESDLQLLRSVFPCVPYPKQW